jgi:hypothetical protein
MAVLVTAIHAAGGALSAQILHLQGGVDGRDKPGRDDERECARVAFT